MNIGRLGSGLGLEHVVKSKKDRNGRNLFSDMEFQDNLKRQDRDCFDKSAVCVGDSYWSNYEYYTVQSIRQIKENGPADKSAVTETEVRYISYGESHHVQINLADGYTYRAQVELSAHSVYVEYRDEEGGAKAYLADVSAICEDSRNPVEQVALEAWNRVLEENRKQWGIISDTKTEENAPLKESRLNEFMKHELPYAYLADEAGIINYRGVTFVGDREKNAICLGDMSNPDDVLTIPLEKGGSLKVNRDNYEDLARAITMFSPEDRNRIMRAISEDKKVQQMKQEIEDEKSGAVFFE